MNRLEQIRKEQNKTQIEVAKALGITYQAYAHYEKGRHAPSPEQLIALADYFDVTVDYLIGREDFTPDERAAGVSETKKISVTPIEEQALNLFRKIGTKHGRETQIEILNMLEKMT